MRTLTFQRTIGAGAFGTVYLAELKTGRGFRRQVAVKVIQAQGPDGDMFLSRIRDEARLLGLLQDDAILKVLDMVQIDGLDGVVMEYIEGVDLDSIVRHQGVPSGQALAELGAQVAGALFRAHTATHPADGSPLNVVHRDVKPANIMLTRSGGVRLLDFGVARAKFEARESYTGQLVLGTLNYMAPEYIVTNQLSPAADVYGLGLSLYEAATSKVFGQPKVRLDSHQRRLEINMEILADGMPALAPVVERMLAWDPKLRPDGAEAERLLWEVANGSRGPGLRQWATQAVPQVLAGRPIAEDGLGLVGRTVQLAAQAAVPEVEANMETPETPALQATRTPAVPAPVPPPTPRLATVPPSQGVAPDRPAPQRAPTAPPPPLTRPAPMAPLPSQPPATMPTPAPTPPSAPQVPGVTPAAPADPAAQDSSDNSLVRDVIKGVMIGGIVGGVLLVGLVVLLLLLRP